MRLRPAWTQVVVSRKSDYFSPSHNVHVRGQKSDISDFEILGRISATHFSLIEKMIGRMIGIIYPESSGWIACHINLMADITPESPSSIYSGCRHEAYKEFGDFEADWSLRLMKTERVANMEDDKLGGKTVLSNSNQNSSLIYTK